MCRQTWAKQNERDYTHPSCPPPPSEFSCPKLNEIKKSSAFKFKRTLPFSKKSPFLFRIFFFFFLFLECAINFRNCYWSITTIQPSVAPFSSTPIVQSFDSTDWKSELGVDFLFGGERGEKDFSFPKLKLKIFVFLSSFNCRTTMGFHAMFNSNLYIEYCLK